MTSDTSEKKKLLSSFIPASLQRPNYLGVLIILSTWIYLYFRVFFTLYDGLSQLYRNIGYVVIKTSIRVIITTTVSASDPSNTVAFGSSKYYALCGLGGILSCGITHTAIVPLDLVKCRIQVLILLLFFLLIINFFLG